ncbi:MAG: hypothetical protein AAFX76_00920 [Planctomycetota bacterium]
MSALSTLLVLAQGAPAPAGPPVGGEGVWLIWAAVLLAAAVALFFVEVFLPTGGIVGAASGLAAVAGVIFLFRVDTTLGLVGATVCLCLLPFAVVFALKLWPNTPFAKWVTLEDQQQALTQTAGGEPSLRPDAGAQPAPQVGDTGKTLTPLHPVGTCLIRGRREECLSHRGTIDAGVAVRVKRVDGSEVYVEAAE